LVGDDRFPVATQKFAYLLFCPILGIPVTGLFESFSNISKRITQLVNNCNEKQGRN